MKKLLYKIVFFAASFIAAATTLNAKANADVHTTDRFNEMTIHTTITYNYTNYSAFAVDAGPVIKAYLSVKEALAGDQVAAAAASAGILAEALGRLEKQTTAAPAKKVFEKEGRSAVKSAQSIAKSRDIQLQRAAFKALSDHVYNLVKAVGTSTTLYLDYCPMAKASWLSDKKAISNPYYGKSMLTCGVVKGTLEP